MTAVDYGIGNIHSVVKALRRVGADVFLTSDPDRIARAGKVVLPGVGAFSDGMQSLERLGLVEPIREQVRRGNALLGICLGMQLLLSESEEFGVHRGLGIIPGRVEAIRAAEGLKIPQIGWNAVLPPSQARWNDSLLAGVAPGTMFYFVHSFTAVPDHDADRLADADYGGQRISAAVACDNVTGFQFHPEKSGPPGLEILGRFVSL